MVNAEVRAPRHIIAVTGLISNRKGQVLLVLNPRRGWELPGGQVEEGETLTHALAREIGEEAGLVISIGPLVGVCSNITPPTKVIFGFLGTWESGDLKISSESLEAVWIDRSQALSRITHPALRDLAQDMLWFSGRIVYRVYSTDPYVVHEVRTL